MEAYQHLRIEREQPVNPKRSGTFPRPIVPDDVAAHGRRLFESFAAAKEATQQDIGGFDDRRLFKLQIGTLSPEAIENIPGVELISQEEGGYALAFANEQALEEFESRLSMLMRGEAPTRKEIFYALQDFDQWTPEDRTGWALRRNGTPADEKFMLDVELWPLSRSNERISLRAAFERWLAEQGIESLDYIDFDSLLVYRVRSTATQTEKLLRHRDVRTVDLPPRFGLEPHLLTLDIQDIPDVPSPKADAPVVAVLDSGIAGGHPLISSALGDAQGFLLPNKRAHDDNGHGTHVAGIALYGDVEECAQAKEFVPQLRLEAVEYWMTVLRETPGCLKTSLPRRSGIFTPNTIAGFLTFLTVTRTNHTWGATCVVLPMSSIDYRESLMYCLWFRPATSRVRTMLQSIGRMTIPIIF
jgi:hypothetical protein